MGLGPALHFEIWHFLIIFLAKKAVYLVSSGKNEISPVLPILRKSLASPGKFYYCPTLAHNLWLIMDNWWTTVLWSGSTKLCNRFRKHFRWFAPKYFLGLHIKSSIDLKVFVATFGIFWGELPPLATRLVLGQGCGTYLFSRAAWIVHYRWRAAKSINFIHLKFYLYLTMRKSDFSWLTVLPNSSPQGD